MRNVWLIVRREYLAGVRTGIDLQKLIAARAPLIAGLPGEPVYGMTPEAGLPKGFTQGSAHA